MHRKVVRSPPLSCKMRLDLIWTLVKVGSARTQNKTVYKDPHPGLQGPSCWSTRTLILGLQGPSYWSTRSLISVYKDQKLYRTTLGLQGSVLLATWVYKDPGSTRIQRMDTKTWLIWNLDNGAVDELKQRQRIHPPNSPKQWWNKCCYKISFLSAL